MSVTKMSVIAMRQAADQKERELTRLLLQVESAKVSLTVVEKESRRSSGEAKVKMAKEKVEESEKMYEDAFADYEVMWDAYLTALAIYQEAEAKAAEHKVAEAKVAEYKNALADIRAELEDAKHLKIITALLNDYQQAETVFREAAATMGVEW